MKKKVLILGSCVSRDIFNYDVAHQFEIVEYFARSSFVSLYDGSKPLQNIAFLDQLSSPFQRRIVSYDLQKKFVEQIGILEFDLLLIDFIDERHNIYEFQDGSRYTLSSELLSTDFLNIYSGKKILSGTPKHFLLWKKAWDDFISHLKILNLLEKVIIQKSFWASRDDNGKNFAGVKKANNYLQQMYDYISKDISKEQFITSSNQVGMTNHRWGRSPFHYVDQYYVDLLSQLTQKALYLNILDKQNAYDPYALHYKIYQHKNYNEFENDFLHDGIHHIKIGQTETSCVDILIDGIDRLDTCEYIIVCLSGAVSNRKGKKAPFFSGLGFAKTVGLPLISIADPTMALDEEIIIGWYAGNKLIQNFSENIAKTLDVLAEKANKKLLFFGGSGGGYGSLLISSYMKTDVLALVWNPQTVIQNHSKKLVQHYEKVAVDDKNNGGIIMDVSKRSFAKNISILYLQNISDYDHCENQMYPFMQNKDYYKLGKSTFVNDKDNVVISLGNFGEGHVVPSYNLLVILVRHLIQKESVVQTAWLLEQGIENLHAPSQKIIELNSYDYFPFRVKSKIVDNQLFLECKFEEDDVNNSQFSFAYYLLCDNKKIDTVWYSHNNTCVFDLPQDGHNFAIQYFVKDIFGVKKTKYVVIEQESKT